MHASPQRDHRVPSRVPAIDALRGAALAGMVVFHLAWDAHVLGLSTVDPTVESVWHGLGQLVAAMFLFLSGASLVLALQSGVSRARILTRLLRVAAAALAVTLASRVFAPEETIAFGILHCIVVTNVIALALKGRSIPLVIGVGVASSIAPYLLSNVVSGPAWTWLGLAAPEPRTLDFRPIFPWLTPVLFGVGAARAGFADRISGWKPGGVVARFMRVAGQHSLAIYLVHQPLLIGAMVLAMQGFGRSPPAWVDLAVPAEARAFLQQCVDACAQNRTEGELCRATCHCVLTALIAQSPSQTSWTRWMPSDQHERLRQASAACLSNAEPVSPFEQSGNAESKQK